MIAVVSMLAYLVQLVGGPENSAFPPGQDKMQHDAQLVCLAAVLPLPCGFKYSPCKCMATSQVLTQSLCREYCWQMLLLLITEQSLYTLILLYFARL